MSIFDINGGVLNQAYNKNGLSVAIAYDKSGDSIYPDGSVRLKIMEYNVGQWYIGNGSPVPSAYDNNYYPLQNGMINNANADVLFICEYSDAFSKSGRTALSLLSQYYPYIETMGGASGYMGRAICSKHPLSNYTNHKYSSNVNRYYDSAEITVGEVTITLVVTHLDTNEYRVPQMTQLVEYLRTLDYFICCGDYNPLTIANGVTTEAQDYTDIALPLINAGFNLANWSNHGFMYTYNDESWNGCLDNIVTSSNINVQSAYVDTTKLTDSISDKVDHMPLIATLQIN